MKPRAVAIAWVLVAALSVLLLLFEVSKWRSLTTEVAQAGAERQRLTDAIKAKEEQLVGEMRQSAAVLQRMQWSSEGTDPSSFLNRMAELAREKRMTVLGIGPLERQTAPQYNKMWHTVQVQAPYREIRELATRIEQDRGLVEALHLEAAPVRVGQSAPSGQRAPVDEVQARFRMTALELTPQAKVIIDRAVAAGGDAAQVGAKSTLALQVPASSPQGTAGGRDPFAFVTPPAPPPPPPGTRPSAGSGGPGSEAPLPPLPDLKGVVSFPDGFLAILNNQIVKVGDTVNGQRVERITDNSVTLSTPGSTPRTINLPELAPAPAPGSRR